MTLFVRIVESGSFTKAANGLDIPRATATLAIQRMESRLGVRLLERTTRQVRPTPRARRSTSVACVSWRSWRMPRRP
ncbi:HTH-type transcriptional regulator BenM [Halomonas elongata]|uniref:HTH-type transcriptional regulator BenM n=1 Tax=Halomonas elongata TaxID=2746 RepID=A0A1B8P168_HALEL|nr:LysR family transcriptional regulator [Halomonas elongata]OBX36004.1 HTH-type transcriptional regulator BenM [Halomonas elongata]